MNARTSWIAISLLGAAVGAYAQSPSTAVAPTTATVAAMYVTNVDKEQVLDLAGASVSKDEVVAGFFPEDLETPEQRAKREACERIIKAGFKCMPPVRTFTRYSIPGVSFGFASAVLPEGMKTQLKVFADAIKGRAAGSPVVRIDGHADASGNEDFNKVLSQRRAESVVEYLVSLGVDKKLLTAFGFGSERPRNASDPKAAENRRVEIARVTAPVQVEK